MSTLSKKLGLTAAAVATSMAFCSVALANQFYAGVTGGANMTPDIKTSYNNSGTSEDAKIKSKTGFNGGVILGVSTNNNLRYEVEVDHMRSSVKDFYIDEATQTNVGGKIKNNVALLNVAYDFTSVGAVVPYIKAGAGYARAKYDVSTADDANKVNGSSNVFAYRGTLGMAYQLDSNLATSLDYTYFGTSKAKFNIKNGDGDNVNVKKRLDRHNINASLIYNFA